MIHLKQAVFSDLDCIEAIQRSSFEGLYTKYRDKDNPYLESREAIEEKFSRPTSHYYLMEANDKIVGFLRVQMNMEETEGWLGIVAVLPEEQQKGYAYQAINLLDATFPKVNKWDLRTILQEKHLVSLYEKCGYRQTQHIENLQDGMDLVAMIKEISCITS
ncbi:GNAT family N-acetyltransferase [Streptococcus entericus]|uniref:GNAT family N-acetyltransferase n=1 Tax=Streptococcus entericus TaxID=155680 RepID=UPI000381F155|nr:GNAT family N-acetyltransferase [Streptococcus entericus]